MFIFSDISANKNQRTDGLESSSSDEFERQENERREDQKEKQAFAQRLLKKDKDKVRAVMSKSERKVSEQKWCRCHGI